MPFVYSVPCQSQGGWEVDIVRNMVHVLNKYPDAVLLGEFFILSLLVLYWPDISTHLPTRNARPAKSRPCPGAPPPKIDEIRRAKLTTDSIALIPLFNTPKNDALKNLFILLCVQIVTILFTEIPLKVRGYNVFIYQNIIINYKYLHNNVRTFVEFFDQLI